MLLLPKLLELARTAATAALLCMAGSAAFAADQIVAVKGKQIEVFSVADNVEPGSMMAVAGLPWAIKEEKNSFYRVVLNGKNAWIDSMQVSVARASSDACPQIGLAHSVQPSSVAGVPGAGPARCK